MITKFVFALLTIIVLACNQGDQNAFDVKRKASSDTLFTIDRDLLQYIDVPKDTLTENGWRVNYKISKSKNSDLYLEWEKGSIKGVQKLEEVLELKSYFIPEYIGENENYLFLSHACATECDGILVLSKSSTLGNFDFLGVVSIDIPTNKILYCLDNEEDKDLFKLRLLLIDIRTSRKDSIEFENLCMTVNSLEKRCIDSVQFNKGELYIKANLTSREDSLKVVYEEKRIPL